MTGVTLRVRRGANPVVDAASGSGVEFGDQAQHDDAGNPQYGQDDRDAVEVTFGDAGGAEVRGDTAAEHVRQPASTPLMQQNEHGEQEARNTEQDLQYNLENLHAKPFTKRWALELHQDHWQL